MMNEDNKPEGNNEDQNNEATGSEQPTAQGNENVEQPTPEETPADGVEGGQPVEAPAEEEAAPDTNVNDQAETDAAQEAHDVAEQVEPAADASEAAPADADTKDSEAAPAAAPTAENVSLNITGEATLSVSVPAGTTVASALKTAGINDAGLQLRDGNGGLITGNTKLDGNTTLSATRKKSGG